MKKILFAVISLIVIPGIVIAQRTSTHRDETSAKKEVSAKDKNVFSARSNIVSLMEMDQRKTYNWGNGQRSTPTGREAGEPGAKYARVFGDSAIVVRKPIMEDQRAYNKKRY